MDLRISSAARAYAEALQRGNGDAGDTGVQGASGSYGGGKAFSDLLKAAVTEPVQALRASEQVSASAAAGKADLVAVTTAVTNAEAAVDTVVAVRDRVVAAYQEILRMPI